MKQELVENINWTAYRKDVEKAISNERLWAMGAGDDAELHKQNIEEYKEELEQAESQRNELFLDALTDIALHVGWEHVEFQDSKERSITLRSWANEFADKHTKTDWEKEDYIILVDEFAAAKVEAYLEVNPQIKQGQPPQERISDIHIYNGRDNRTYIRCKIDGEQQMGVALKFADVCRLDDRTDRQELAARYFRDALEPEQAREQAMKR